MRSSFKKNMYRPRFKCARHKEVCKWGVRHKMSHKSYPRGSWRRWCPLSLMAFCEIRSGSHVLLLLCFSSLCNLPGSVFYCVLDWRAFFFGSLQKLDNCRFCFCDCCYSQNKSEFLFFVFVCLFYLWSTLFYYLEK